MAERSIAVPPRREKLLNLRGFLNFSRLYEHPKMLGVFLIIMYYVYILLSLLNGRHYIGFSSDVMRRINQHNEGLVQSTKAYRPWKLIHLESYKDRSSAMQREKKRK